jgi:uroporphyrinogen-III synthase
VNRPLAGIAVLVTRPKSAAAGLVERVRELGGHAIWQPGIELLPSSDDEPSLALLEQLDGNELIIFTSANAVRFALQRHGAETYAGSSGLIAVGQRTADALADHGLDTVSVPTSGADSESILQLPILAEVTGRHILIACAPGGRELLQEHLSARGARVDPVFLYHRKPAIAEPQALEQIRSARGQLVTTVTSQAILKNITDLIRSELLSQPLCVISDRVADYARHMGYQKIHVVSAPGDTSMIEAVLKASRNLDGRAVH